MYYNIGTKLDERVIKLSVEFSENVDECPSNENFRLHSHENYEIYLFLEGDTKYIVEEKTYTLKPYDIIVIRKNEMHRVFHNGISRYKRFVINVSPEFFEIHNCKEYEKQFLTVGDGNKIEADTVLSSGIYDAFMRLKKYSKNCKETSSPISISIITEILYLLSDTKSYTVGDSKSTAVSSVMEYLNANFREDIKLEELEKMFFISKYHLCHAFKKATGLTVHGYITRKRINYVKELVKSGDKLGQAYSRAGFNSYSSFYRAYMNEYGAPPKLGLNLAEHKNS